MIVRRTLEICNQLVTEQAPETIRKLGTETKHPNMFWQSQRAALDKGLIVQINAPLRARRALRGLVKPRKNSALDGFGCPTEAPYGCFLPDLTRFGTCRHPNPSNALGARYILPAPVQLSKMSRGQRENHMSARQQKRRGRKYATASHQLLHREHSSAAKRNVIRRRRR